MSGPRYVPILDDDYMRARASMRDAQAFMESMHRIKTYGRADDTPESLRDDYAAGRIDYDELQRRLDDALGLRPCKPL